MGEPSGDAEETFTKRFLPMKYPPYLIAAIAVLMSGCSDKKEYSDFKDAETTGREIVEAIRNGNTEKLLAKLSPSSPYQPDNEQISQELSYLTERCGKLQEPALLDVKALSEEDFSEDETPLRGAIQIYAAMLTDGSGSSDAACVDLTVRLVPGKDDNFQMIDWDYVPISAEEAN